MMSKRKPTKQESDDEAEEDWDLDAQIKPPLDLLHALLDRALNNKCPDAESLALHLVEVACALQCTLSDDKGAACRLIRKEVESYFRGGGLEPVFAIVQCAGCGHRASIQNRPFNLAGKALTCSRCGQDLATVSESVTAAARSVRAQWAEAAAKPKPPEISDEDKKTLH